MPFAKLGLFFALLTSFPSLLSASQIAEVYCGQTAPPLIASALLDKAANETEQLLAGEPAEEAVLLAALNLDENPSAQAPDPLALARYCAAAGEVMRIVVSGSARQARAYLMTALRLAEQDGDSELSAQIAYRLALTVSKGQASPNASTASRSLRAAFDPAPPSEPAPTSANNACEPIFRAEFREQPGWLATQQSLDCAVANSRRAGDYQLSALAQLQLARNEIAEAQKRPRARTELLGWAVRDAMAGVGDARAMPNSAKRAELIARLLEAALDAGAGDSPATREALALLVNSPEYGPADQAFRYALRGRMLLAAGRDDEALGSFRQAVFFESQRAQPLRLADWYLLLAEAEPDARQRHVTQAYRALENVRPLLPLADPLTEESAFARHMQPVFKAAVAMQLDIAAQDSDPRHIANAQFIVETFRQAEVQSSFGRDCVPPRAPITPADLRPGEMLLYPILLDDRVELLVASADSDAYRRLAPIRNSTRDEVAMLVSEMAYSLGYGFDDGWERPARTLYDILIAPVADQLSGDGTLIIVPDGALRLLPFAALRDDSGKLLVEATKLSVAPALAYAQPGSQLSGSPGIVAAALEAEVALPAGVFPALKGTAGEAKMAAGLGDSEARSGLLLENFKRGDLEQAFASRQIDILHLATHAAFNGRSDRSFIVADGEAILLSELRAMIERNQSRGEALSLIVLSACETAVGDDQATMGLAGTAVQAGAESAIASLWEVDDAGTVELMRQFYRNISAGQGRADALRNAQLALIRGGDDFADPGIWSAFTLLGGWR